MKLLHTSDWHLGRAFHGVGTLDAQRRFADQLLDTVTGQGVDVVLIAGDVYDRALPGVDVVNLFDDILARLNRAGVQVVVTSGNHDSATRLGFGGRLLESAGVHLRTRIADLAVPVLLPLEPDAPGEPGGAAGPQLAIYGIPYLEPRLVAEDLGVETATHFGVTEAAVELIRADLASRPPGTASIVLAHTFASGGITSESERDLAIGGVGAVRLQESPRMTSPPPGFDLNKAMASSEHCRSLSFGDAVLVWSITRAGDIWSELAQLDAQHPAADPVAYQALLDRLELAPRA